MFASPVVDDPAVRMIRGSSDPGLPCVALLGLSVFILEADTAHFPDSHPLRRQQPSVFVNPIVNDPAVSMDRGPSDLDLSRVAALDLPSVMEEG